MTQDAIGSSHKVATKHLDAYLDELEWRFNNRENPLPVQGYTGEITGVGELGVSGTGWTIVIDGWLLIIGGLLRATIAVIRIANTATNADIIVQRAILFCVA